MTVRTLNTLYIAALILVIGAGVFLLYDDVYFWITGNRLRADVAGEATQKPDIPSISTDELAEKIQKKESFLLLDVRTPEEFQDGHIEQAVNLPLADIDNQIGKLALAKNREIITMCDNEGCNRADQAATKLIGLGFENVRSYHDGITAWKASGRTTVTTTVNQDSFIDIFKDFKTQEISVTDAQKKIANPQTIVLDVQKQENYNKEHLENAIFVDLNSASPRAKDGSIPKDRHIVIYSEDGIRSKIATEAFLSNGYKNVWSMTGGIAAWKAQKLTITNN